MPSLAVTSAEVAAFHPLVLKTARRLVGAGGAEFEDLYQEGMIAVWDCLRTGFDPSDVVIRNRMIDWVRKCRRQGFSYDETSGDDLLDE